MATPKVINYNISVKITAFMPPNAEYMVITPPVIIITTLFENPIK